MHEQTVVDFVENQCMSSDTSQIWQLFRRKWLQINMVYLKFPCMASVYMWYYPCAHASTHTVDFVDMQYILHLILHKMQLLRHKHILH